MPTPNLTITATAYLVDGRRDQATLDRLAQQVDAALAAVANTIEVRVEATALLSSTIGVIR